MTTDYQGNSKKEKEAAAASQPEKETVEKVVSGDVIVVKKGLGRKFRDLIHEADFKGVVFYVIREHLIPAGKNMFVDAIASGAERAVYGEGATRRRFFGPGPSTGPKVSYQTPVNRTRTVPIPRGPGGLVQSQRRQSLGDVYVLSSRQEAELVIERMNDIADQYGAVSLLDLNDLLGQQGTHTDNKWGWSQVGNLPIHQTREGYLIEFPPMEPLSN